MSIGGGEFWYMNTSCVVGWFRAVKSNHDQESFGSSHDQAELAFL
ncbi:MAG: hypothetical protein ACYCOU_17320 [Sulfobacillus sp.]